MALRRARLVAGGVAQVMARLQALIEGTGADELMITTMVYDHEARKHSYELLAKAFALVPQS
jgi:alkanesulfonate monooxygenase SsuD/methylene tetrahydromethanopterin reductase-like flavin-dependent oxidoreductase (luciferase family)